MIGGAKIVHEVGLGGHRVIGGVVGAMLRLFDQVQRAKPLAQLRHQVAVRSDDVLVGNRLSGFATPNHVLDDPRDAVRAIRSTG